MQKNEEDFGAICAQSNKKVNSLRRALFIPTDLATKFIDSSCTSADLVSIEVNKEGIETTTVKECKVEYRKTILHWIALFDSDIIGEISFKSCLEDDSLVSASRSLHFQHLKGSTKERNKQLIGGCGDQSEAPAMSIYQPKHLQLLQEQAKHLSSSLAYIFMGRNNYDKAKILEVHLRKEGILDVCLSIAQSKDLVNGHWTWKNSNTPSGFSFVLFSRSNPLHGSSTSDKICYLSLKTKKEMDSTSLKRLTESDIMIPSDEHGIMACLQTGTACLKCFKQDALIVRYLKKFLTDLHINKHLIRITCLKDSSFPTAFLCAVDSRVCSYLLQCKINHDDMVLIPLALISFDDITLRLRKGTFIFTNIPSAIKSTRLHSPATSPEPKRQKTKGKEKRVVQIKTRTMTYCARTTKIMGKYMERQRWSI